MSKKNSPHDPLKNAALKGDLKALRDRMEAEDKARKAEEEARKAAARERGELEARAKKSPSATAPARPKSADLDVWRPDFDKHLFEVAMAGVKPLTPAATRVSAREPSASPNHRKPSLETKLKRAAAEGAPTFAIEWSEDHSVRGWRRGQEFALEALGRFATPEETLDLHGLDVASVAPRVAEFVRTRRARGRRCVCVVHGQGRNAPDGKSVLLDIVVDVLKGPTAAAEVDAFTTAPHEHGGRGALLISLRS